jgi:putative tryptophan/tyrosine transport system substrate-binding protein
MAIVIGRRKFIIGAGCTAMVWPLTASAQQSAIPVIGILSAAQALTGEKRMIAFRQGLSEKGYIEGQNVAVEYLQADGQFNRLPALAAELVRRHVSVIVAPNSADAAIAAHNATKVIPIIFGVTGEPAKLGLVASLAQPAGNATGVNNFSTELAAKRLGLLHQLLPNAAVVAVLFNPANAENEAALKEVQSVAGDIGQRIRVVNASTIGEIEEAFETLARESPEALLLINDPLFSSQKLQIISLAARNALPAIYTTREYTEAGGLMSYATNLSDAYRQMGIYTGRVLKGENPPDLPVVQPTKFELVINLKTAKALGLTIPPGVLAIADDVIE